MGTLDADDPQTRATLEGFSFGVLPQENLLTYIREMLWRIRLVRASQTLDFCLGYNEKDKKSLFLLLAEVERLGREASELARARQDRELLLNEQMKLRIRLKNVENKCDHTIAEIKELCSGRG